MRKLTKHRVKNVNRCNVQVNIHVLNINNIKNILSIKIYNISICTMVVKGHSKHHKEVYKVMY